MIKSLRTRQMSGDRIPTATHEELVFKVQELIDAFNKHLEDEHGEDKK